MSISQSVAAKDRLQELLQAVRFRLWIRSVLESLTLSALIVAIAWVGLAVVRNFATFDVPVSAGALAVMSLMIGVIRLAQSQHQFRTPQVARLIDRQARLKNRLTAALQTLNDPDQGIQKLLVDDAVRMTERISPASVVPWPKPVRAAASVIAVGVAWASLSVSPWWVPAIAADQQPIHQVVDAEGLDQLEETLKKILDQLKSIADQNSSESLNDMVKETESLLDQIQQQELSTAEAFLKLSALQQKLVAASDEAVSSELQPAWQDIAEAMQSSETLSTAGEALDNQLFRQAAEKMQGISAEQLSGDKLSEAERTSVSEKLNEAADASQQAGDEELAQVLNDLAENVASGNGEAAAQQMQDLAEEASKFQFDLDQAQHLDDLADQVALSKQSLSIKSNSSGDGQMGGRGLNEETGQSEGKGGADSQKAGAKTAGNVDGPKADLDGQKKLAELQGQFGEVGDAEVRTKSTDQAPEFEITRKAQAVHTEYSRQLEADLQRQSIPAGHEEIIRRYFESIRPAPGSDLPPSSQR